MVLKGGVYNSKQHLVGGYENIVSWQIVSEQVKEEITQYVLKKKEAKEQVNLLPTVDDVVDEGGEDEEVEIRRNLGILNRQVAQKSRCILYT